MTSPESFIAAHEAAMRTQGTARSSAYRDMAIIERIVSKHTHISPEVWKTRTRKGEIVEARQIFCHLVMSLLNKKYGTMAGPSAIGMMTNKDHATALHAVRTVDNFIETDKAFRKKYNAIKGDCIAAIDPTLTSSLSGRRDIFMIRADLMIAQVREIEAEMDTYKITYDRYEPK